MKTGPTHRILFGEPTPRPAPDMVLACRRCCSTETLTAIRSRGAISCCPERRIVPMARAAYEAKRSELILAAWGSLSPLNPGAK
jgi:hypothetical protein